MDDNYAVRWFGFILYGGTGLKLFILVSWNRSFLSSFLIHHGGYHNLKVAAHSAYAVFS